MARPAIFNLDELQKQMLATLPPSDSSVCCCRLVDPSLQAGQHLEDCVLQLMDPSRPRPSSEDFTYASSGSSSPTEDQGTAKRRKHRESMARLRQTWRTSIAALQRQEKQLQSELRRAVTSPNNKSETDDSDPLEVLRRAYCELVQEQLRLQDELTELEAERAHKEKYERLLERELDRARTFRAIANGIDSPRDQ